jgi:apolipoprotein N-acyltransferase
MQGLRHAHPAMFLCWLLLSAYLAIYLPLFLYSLRHLRKLGAPLMIAAPLLWVGWEWVRNYCFTGISAAMLGHSLTPVLPLIQIADLGGSYAVSLLVVVVNVAFVEAIRLVYRETSGQSAAVSIVIAIGFFGATYSYGQYRLRELVPSGAERFLVIGRTDEVEYDQDAQREAEIFSLYAQQSIQSARGKQQIDVVVWPESMFTGTLPWMEATEHATAPQSFGISNSEFRRLLSANRDSFKNRAASLQQAIAAAVPQQIPPQLIVGCGVVRYAEHPEIYSAIVQLDSGGNVVGWYGKNHLVMFGEYIPLISHIPGLRSLIPPGLGVHSGNGPVAFQIGSSQVAANICIESAVERVPVTHLAQLHAAGQYPHLWITVTNDRWFDHSSIVEHHLRCAQFVAVGCRRDILSSANGGPTAWIDSTGRVRERLRYDSNGGIVAVPGRDGRASLYVRIGDWPACIIGWLAILSVIHAGVCWARQSHCQREPVASAETN